MLQPAPPNFWQKVATGDPDECWNWLASKDGAGYGKVKTRGVEHRAHRVSYESVVGLIPAGLQIDHLCRNKGCVNPSHLEPVTCRENLMRGDTQAARNAAKTHCKHGHEFSVENTYVSPDGYRYCKKCRSVNKRNYLERVAA